MSKSYKKLIVWEKSIDLVTAIYSITNNFPDEEKFGLVSQMRRSAVSIPSNIAEGHGRGTDGELAHFLHIAYGSSSELETQLTIALRLDFISKADFDRIDISLVEIRKMLNKFISNLLKAKD